MMTQLHPLAELKRKIQQATVQCRHNNDNSPSLFHPDMGFVEAYDMEKVNRALAEFESTIKSDFRATAEVR